MGINVKISTLLFFAEICFCRYMVFVRQQKCGCMFLLWGCSDALLSCSCLPGAWECVCVCVHTCVCECMSAGQLCPRYVGTWPSCHKPYCGRSLWKHGNKMYVRLSAGTDRELSVVNINKWVSSEYISSLISHIISVDQIDNSYRTGRSDKALVLIVYTECNTMRPVGWNVHQRSEVWTPSLNHNQLLWDPKRQTCCTLYHTVNVKK